MIRIDLENGGAISTQSGDGLDVLAGITISKNNIVQGMVLLTANELAKLIKDLKIVYLSLAGIE